MNIAARLPLTLAALLAAAPALAQGTAEQQEACAPDAVKLCQDTIPDIPKTTACMKRHFAELSPRCQTAFNAATGPASGPSRGARREEIAPPPPAGRAPDEDEIGAEEAERAPEQVPGLHAYQNHIRELCREGLVDSFTCRNTLDALKASE